MESTRIEFPGSRGAPLAARLDRPIGREPEAYAIFAHCFTCSKNLKAVVHLSRALTAHGLAVLRFDFTGLGESGGDFADTTFSSNIDDLLAAARWLEEHHRPPQLLVGHSLGGAAVLAAGAELPGISAVSTIGAPADPAHVARLLGSSRERIEREGEAEVELGGRRFRIRKAFLDDLAERCNDEAIGSLGAALLLFHSPVDAIVGIENAERIYRAARHPKSFISLDRADHLLSDPRDSAYAGDVLGAWAGRYLDGAAAPEPAVSTPGSTPPPDEGRVFARIGREPYRTEIRAGRHGLLADEPERVGGGDRGPTPYDLLLAALGACTAMTLRMYADRKGWPMEAVDVELEHRREHARDCDDCGAGARVDVIERRLAVRGDLDEAQRSRLVEIANRCPVHRTLEEGARIETVLSAGS